MASIFTFDPDPPRVSSPWVMTLEKDRPTEDESHMPLREFSSPIGTSSGIRYASCPIDSHRIDYESITRLEAEPQDGPTEYKLHLLLRRRRSFTSVSTGHHISGSFRRSENLTPTSATRSVSESNILASTPPPLSALQSRQHRLEQLTTQLLWRLQQSCPYHVSSSTATLISKLSDDVSLPSLEKPQRLLPGLEESKGALYEIGVADDGVIVGLAEDEMDESLNNLRVMAASLGCGVEVLRMVPVGDCEWIEDAGGTHPKIQKSKLLVAEALVRPLQHLIDYAKENKQRSCKPLVSSEQLAAHEDLHKFKATTTQQLRVSVTGATNSGKSSLLGTLSTSTLDNGRGKSRLNLLKHRHEIVSGMTSSVTQELIGYRDILNHDQQNISQVINYGSGDISSWIDIHAAVESAESGRLVFLCDSAGHPRFRRTTVRGIVGWQPHWTLLCVPAESSSSSLEQVSATPSSQDSLGFSAVPLDLSLAHLHLCLTLKLRLILIITKYDLATKAGLRQTLSSMLSALKGAGRKPCIISDSPTSESEIDLHTITTTDSEAMEDVLESMQSPKSTVVVIVLTSAVNGKGINKLHALLRRLPLLSEQATTHENSPTCLFNIEDFYSLKVDQSTEKSIVVGGFLRYGSLSIGDELILGPYPIDTGADDSDSEKQTSARIAIPPTSRSFPGAIKKSRLLQRSNHSHQSEWRRVRITSLRNLRLPVSTLYAGQVGTIGINSAESDSIGISLTDRIRKGMVLASDRPNACKLITARFENDQAQAIGELSIGSAVIIYTASVRASSKIVSVAIQPRAPSEPSNIHGEDDAFGFGFDEETDSAQNSPSSSATLATFQFIASKEFVEMGAKVLVMSGSGQGLPSGGAKVTIGAAGLKGFVGIVVEQH